ncbi:hypothetical protein MED297_17023 [Reinekea sp. MED297]|uniref:DUF4198 domain-containing protein n=2 Tax=Reinekea TaxID=230494 RepID=A4BFH0_9GAMM|nr:hypothetical protein MED297_17023 [Reinekea sp. MED297] [Reinekea blandensis MED297]
MVYLFAVATVQAHDFWLEPEAYTSTPGEEIAIEWRIGQGFLGESLVFLPFNADQVAIWLGGEPTALSPRFAARPALSVALPDDGSAIVSTVTPKFDLQYDAWSEFQDFVEHEAIGVTLPAPAAGPVKEQYQRFAKTLLSSGNHRWQDERLGLRYEWVVQPESEHSLMATLYFDSEPASDHSVKVYVKQPAQPAKTIEPTFYRTNAQGQLLIRALRPGDQVLLNALHLVHEPDNEWSWQSYWASTTLQMPE